MSDVRRLYEYVVTNLAGQLSTKDLGDEYFYQSLPLAAIDAVFSARATYPSVQKVVQRYCDRYHLAIFRSPKTRLPPHESQESVSSLVQKMKCYGIPFFAEDVFENRSVTCGRRKAEVLLDLLEALERLQIQTFQDMQACVNHPSQRQPLIDAITAVHGIGEATYRYLLMLTGDNQMVKPDTMILRFARNALGHPVSHQDAVTLIQSVSRMLLPRYPKMDPRTLDHLIWSWQRDQREAKSFAGTSGWQEELRENQTISSDSPLLLQRNGNLTIPQKTQHAMHLRYRPGQRLSRSQIVKDVLADYPETKPRSVIPSDYCSNISNADPRSGIFHIFFFEEDSKEYRLLPEIDISVARQPGIAS